MIRDNLFFIIPLQLRITNTVICNALIFDKVKELISHLNWIYGIKKLIYLAITFIIQRISKEKKKYCEFFRALLYDLRKQDIHEEPNNPEIIS